MTSESEIVGKWLAKGGAVVEDENCKKISWLAGLIFGDLQKAMRCSLWQLVRF